MVSSNGQSNGHVEQLPQPVQARPKWAAECRVREYDTGFGIRYSVYHPSEHVLVPSGRSVKWIECTGLAHGSVYGTSADALDAMDQAVRLGIAPPEDAEAVACDRTNNTTKGTDAGAEDQGAGGTTGSAAAPKVERPAALSEANSAGATRSTINPARPDVQTPAVVLGQGSYARRWPDNGTVGPYPDAKAQEDAAAIEKAVDELADQFGLPKPPEGKGVPAAPSPDFLTWDDRPVYRGAVLAPVTAPDSQWIAGEIVAGDLLELIGVDGKREIMLSREAFKSCWGYADRRAETQQDPEDIAQAIFLELDLAVKTEPTRRRLRSLVLKLLRSR